jgi:hypothetical protein
MRRALFFLLAVALIVGGVLAQQTGTLRGVLTDNSGAVIPAGTVSISGNGVERSVKTQNDGTYSFTGLAPGQYSVKVIFPGFADYIRAVTVSGRTTQLAIQLSVGAADKQVITVQGEAGPTVNVEADNNATALVIKGEDLEALPDDPDDLQDALEALAGPGAGPNGGQIYIDGFTGGQLPPKESIREIRINQNPFSAEYDRLGFGRIEILTKPGTDQYRGALSLNESNSVFNSRNPFASNKPDFSNRQVSGSFGGPINHRSSFFFDFNRRDIQDNAITHAQYLTAAALPPLNITTAVVTPSGFTTISPRVDYQLNANNTLIARFEERFNDRQNAGLGGTSLPPPYSQIPYNVNGDAQNLMLTETAVLSSKVINETRFQWTRTWSNSLGNLIPSINVAGAFTMGGNGVGNEYDLARHYELTNITSVVHGVHTVRFGVRVRRDGDQNNNPQGFNGQFTFLGGLAPVLDSTNDPIPGQTVELTSLQQYARNLQLQQAGYTETQIQQLGGGPSRFSIQAGRSYIGMARWDASPFIQDDWRVRPNITLSAGLRFEDQNLITDNRDVAPRIGFAWAPGKAGNGRQKTVVRGGFGIFYDRVSYTPYENAILNNGVNQLEYTAYNPLFYPNIPALSTLSPGQNTINLVDPKLRTDYSIQSAIGVERQLPRSTTLAVTYTNNRSDHLSQTIPINTPLPGTFNPLQPLSANNGVFPYGYNAGVLEEYESGGFLKQSIMMVNFNTRFSRRVSLFGNYSLTYAKGLQGTPSDPFDFLLDYGRSTLDRRNNFQLTGSVIGPKGIRFAPFITMRSGSPYDVTLGYDLFGDNGTARADLFSAAGAGCSPSGNVVCTKYGGFSTIANAASLGNVVPKNYLTMAGLISVNMRVYRVFGFGPVRGANAAPSGGPGGGPGGRGGFAGGRGGFGGGGGRGGAGGMRMGGGGGRGGFGGGGDTTERRYNVTVGVNFANMLNHFNPGGYVGVMTSPFFGQATSVNTGFGGGGFGGGVGGGSVANNRRLDMSMRFTF